MPLVLLCSACALATKKSNEVLAMLTVSLREIEVDRYPTGCAAFDLMCDESCTQSVSMVNYDGFLNIACK